MFANILDEAHGTADSSMEEMRAVFGRMRVDSGLAELEPAVRTAGRGTPPGLNARPVNGSQSSTTTDQPPPQRAVPTVSGLPGATSSHDLIRGHS